MAVYPLPPRPSRPRPAWPPPEGGAAPGASPSGGLREAFVRLCRLDIAVESLRGDPAPARFDLGEGAIGHRAQWEVVGDGGTALVDVAGAEALQDHPLRVAIVCGGLEAEDGRLFRFETAETLRAEPRLSALRLVLSCRAVPVSPGDRVAILHHVGEARPSTLVEAAAVARHAPDGVAAVLSLAAEGLLALDLDGSILPETRLRRRAPGAV